MNHTGYLQENSFRWFQYVKPLHLRHSDRNDIYTPFGKIFRRSNLDCNRCREGFACLNHGIGIFENRGTIRYCIILSIMFLIIGLYQRSVNSKFHIHILIYFVCGRGSNCIRRRGILHYKLCYGCSFRSCDKSYIFIIIKFITLRTTQNG